MNDQLVAAIFARVQRYFEASDAAGLLDDAVTTQTADLAAPIFEGNLADIEVIPLLLLVHLTRYQLLPPSDSQPDLQTSLELVTLLDASNRSDLVTPEIRIALQQATHDKVIDVAAGFVKAGNDALRAYELTGHISELAGAIEQYQSALEALPVDHPSRAPILTNLGNAFQARFRRTGKLSDLEDAINFGRVAVNTLPADHPNLATCLSNLGGALQIRFLQVGQGGDLDDAIGIAFRAVKAPVSSGGSTALRLSNLANALRLRFERTGQSEDLDEAILAARRAVESASPYNIHDHMEYQCNLGLVLFRRYEQAGLEEDLDEAVDIVRKVATTVGSEHPNHASYMSNLGNMVRHRARRTQSPVELNEAVDACKRAVITTPPDHPSLSTRFFNLGAALRDRFELGGNHADHTNAINSLRAATRVTAGIPVVRINAARAWSALAAEKGDDASAAEALSAAVSILPLVTWRGLDRVTREYHLSNAVGLATDAAASALNVGQTGRAVELLDQGRSVLWLSLLHIRTDLSDLARITPTVAARLDEIRRVLDLASADAYSVAANEAAMSDFGPKAGRDRM